MKDSEKVKEVINEAYKQIENPEEFKLKIEFLRYNLGKAFEYETNCKGNINEKDESIVKEYRDKLSIVKDTYDLAALWKVKKIDDLIMQKVEELNREKEVL